MPIHLRGSMRFCGAALIFLAACDSRSSNPVAAPVPDAPTDATAELTCSAVVATGVVTCGPAAVEGGAAFDRRSVGGQGRYVRITSSSVTYAADVFAFDVVVQNSSNLAMATVNGTTADGEGVRIVIPATPVATSGTGTITVANETGQAVFSGSEPQDYFQYGGTTGAEISADGILTPGEVSSVKRWQFNVPASVTTFSFTVWVSTQTPSGTLETIAPQVTGVSPSPMVRRGTVTITGINFDPTPANNIVNIGGINVVPSAATATSLTITVPCVPSKDVPIYATRGNLRGESTAFPATGSQRTVGIGQALFLTDPVDVACTDLSSVGGTARYIVSVYSASTSPSSNSPFQLVSDGARTVAAARAPAADVTLPGLQEQVAATAESNADARHYDLLEKNRTAYEVLRRQNAGAENGARRNVTAVAGTVAPPLTRTFRVSNITVNSGICSNFYVVSATRVYYNGKIAIYEDDATPDGFKSSLNATMAANYQKIGDQFNADMEPIIRNNFGDVLRRDAETDNNGV
ncbi:MAG TPA: IPT/TIG domain-containing protein, partial [Longimicrobium sp.]|nr:IPT/TIG domain-containing protein [Longimicrobium sp.]